MSTKKFKEIMNQDKKRVVNKIVTGEISRKEFTKLQWDKFLKRGN